jgi:transposase
MNVYKYGSGIDISKEKFDAVLGEISAENGFKKISSGQFQNTMAGFKKYQQWIAKHCKLNVPVIHLMEASGVYYENLALYLVLHEHQRVTVVLPNKAKKYKESLGYKSKTDGIDAQALSQMACEQTHALWQPPVEKFYRLRLLTRQIENITVQTTAVKNQMEALIQSVFPPKDIIKMLRQQIAFLLKQKTALIKTMEQLIHSDEELKSKFEHIKIIKGVGTLTIATVVAETGGFSLFKNISQLVSYAGYDVVENESGTHTGKTKISKRGNGRIRRVLHFPALNMVRYNVSPFAGLYQRIYDRNKIKMKGYVAVQKKLLVIIYTLWKKDEPFNQNQSHDKTSGESEKAPFLVSASKKQYKKAVPPKNGTAQDKHPSKHRSMPSLV